MANSKGNFSWNQFWAFYRAPHYTDELRKETYDGMHLPDILESAPIDAQIEIMESAPDEIKFNNLVIDALHPVARTKLKIACSDVDVVKYVRRNLDKLKNETQ